jgi:hypothetical protein
MGRELSDAMFHANASKSASSTAFWKRQSVLSFSMAFMIG